MRERAREREGAREDERGRERGARDAGSGPPARLVGRARRVRDVTTDDACARARACCSWA